MIRLNPQDKQLRYPSRPFPEKPGQAGPIVLPESRVTAVESLAVTGNVLNAINGVLLLCSPLVARKAGLLARHLQVILAKLRIGLSSERKRKLQLLFANQQDFQAWVRKMIMFTGFFAACSSLEVGLDTKQPTIAAASVLHGAIQVLGVKLPKNNYIWNAAALRASVYNTGKHTELENYNHPDSRREWDIRRLNPFAVHHESPSQIQSGAHYQHHRIEDPKSLGQELKSYFRFIGGDMAFTLSVKPWQEFSRNYRKKETWKTPQPYLSAINAQLNLAAFVFSMSGLALKKKWLQILAMPFVLSSDGIMHLLISTRALQNRDDPDGKLVLFGSPLALFGLLFQPNLTQRFFFLNGINLIGSAFSNRGMTLNAKKQGYLVDSLKAVYEQAKANPGIRAESVLQQFQTPAQQKILRRRMGKNRSAFFIRALKQAALAGKNRGTALADYMQPIAESKR